MARQLLDTGTQQGRVLLICLEMVPKVEQGDQTHLVIDPFGLAQTMGVVAFAGGGILGLGTSNEHACTLSPRQADGKAGDK